MTWEKNEYDPPTCREIFLSVLCALGLFAMYLLGAWINGN